MSNQIMLVPICSEVETVGTCAGIAYAMRTKGFSTRVFEPIAERVDRHVSCVPKDAREFSVRSSSPLSAHDAHVLLSANRDDLMLEFVLKRFLRHQKKNQIVLIRGLSQSLTRPFAHKLNKKIASALDCRVIFSINFDDNYARCASTHARLFYSYFGGREHKNILGSVVHRFDSLEPNAERRLSNLPMLRNYFPNKHVPEARVRLNVPSVLGCVPWNCSLMTIRVIDIVRYLNLEVLTARDTRQDKISSITFCTDGLSKARTGFFPGSFLVVPSNRMDVFRAACRSAENGVRISAILLTSPQLPDSPVRNAWTACTTSILRTNLNIWEVSTKLNGYRFEFLTDDADRVRTIARHVARHLRAERIVSSLSTTPTRLASSAQFLHSLTQSARSSKRRILLPEGENVQIIQAAAICARKRTARCVLLGDPETIVGLARLHRISFDGSLKIVDPARIRKQYVLPLWKLRRRKGMTQGAAARQVRNNTVLGTLMLRTNKVDGLVSGISHTTAETIRPAFQLIGTSRRHSLVSSTFFMLFPRRVLVYADCAINPNPTHAQLAEIAIQSSNSAERFGIVPRVAMISYSTGNSGKGPDVETVRKATMLVKERRPDLIVDGPMQYDAAVALDVARSKCPDSSVGGRATVFVFPDLNTGNTVYKAVQRSTDIVSIGPILQGIKQPVNDLSRGASIADIVHTINVTAVQSLHSNE